MLASKQRLVFTIERGNVSLSMLNLPGETKEGDAVSLIGPIIGPLIEHCSVDLEMVVEQLLQSLGVTAAIRLVGARHQQREVLLFCLVTGKVRVNALCNLAKQRLETRRRIKLF